MVKISCGPDNSKTIEIFDLPVGRILEKKGRWVLEWDNSFTAFDNIECPESGFDSSEDAENFIVKIIQSMTEAFPFEFSPTIHLDSPDLKPIREQIKGFDFSSTVSQLAGLLTVPSLHANNLRIETLVHLAVAFCQGNRKPNLSHFTRWINERNEPLGA